MSSHTVSRPVLGVGGVTHAGLLAVFGACFFYAPHDPDRLTRAMNELQPVCLPERWHSLTPDDTLSGGISNRPQQFPNRRHEMLRCQSAEVLATRCGLDVLLIAR
jgi:hypothetical protein